ncbi:transmembrane anchor protein, partial [Acinetobacter baumannii]
LSTKKLVKPIIIAPVSAVVVLFTVVMPAENNIDPTGVGKVLGLTTMGEIKQSLAQESENGMGESVSNTISSEAASDPNIQS